MADIDIEVGWHAGILDAVRIKARTPNPSAALVGLSPATVAAMLGRLYAVCGAAQRACAELALGAASGAGLAPERHHRLAAAVAAEAIQERLWRLWLDWPPALGLAPRRDEFTYWWGCIKSGAADWPTRLAATLERDWLGTPFTALTRFGVLAEFDAWCAAGRSPAATLFAALGAEAAAAARSAPPGEPSAGANRRHPWSAALSAAGRGLEWHLAQRMLSLAALDEVLQHDPPPSVEMSSGSTAAGRGFATVATARGRLRHEVSLCDGHVESYAIQTPTERHFAADGPFAASILGRRAADGAAARRIASLWALAFDPCVSYAVADPGAAHA